jgi:hypothetical protein
MRWEDLNIILPVVLLPVTGVALRYRLAYYPKVQNISTGNEERGGDEQQVLAANEAPGIVGITMKIYQKEVRDTLSYLTLILIF